MIRLVLLANSLTTGRRYECIDLLPYSLFEPVSTVHYSYDIVSASLDKTADGSII